MALINQRSGASNRNAIRPSGDRPYLPEHTRYDTSEPVGPRAWEECPEGYTADGNGGCYCMDGTLSLEILDTLTRVVRSIAASEKAGSDILHASAQVINSMTGPTFDPASTPENITNVLDAAQNLATTVANLECVLAKKLCCTLSSVCECGQCPNGPSCCVLTGDMEDALCDIVTSIAKQETTAAELVTAGSGVLDYANESDDADFAQDALCALSGLANASAGVERALERKLCLSLGALVSCSPTLPTCFGDALEEVIESIVESEEGASKLILTSAATLEDVASMDYESIEKTINTVKDLTDAAYKIEEVTMRKLCLTLAVLCGDEEDISDQISNSCDTSDMGNCDAICTLLDRRACKSEEPEEE